ncbi:MAG: ferrous iron transporter B [Deltaproteobacteria bacterium]|nr:ferrous iron transporter B [Deltaproteobacteria bacterium]
MSTATKADPKVMIVGLPNTGKSHVFINLSGQYTAVANSPLTTIEMKRARFKIEEQVYEIIDTPGLLSVYSYSEEDKLVREAIFSEPPDVIIQCIDANRLKQSLVLTIELILTGIPLIISLNALDETARKGIWIDSPGLSGLLGVPVVESIPVAGGGVSELKAAIARAKPGKLSAVSYGPVIDQGLMVLASKLPEHIHFRHLVAFLLMRQDPLVMEYLQKTCGSEILTELKQEMENLSGQFLGGLNRAIDKHRSSWIDDLVEKVVKRQKVSQKEVYQTIARLTRHPIFGPPILVVILSIMFMLVVHVANGISEWLTNKLWVPVEAILSKVLPAGFWHDFFIGDYGVISLGLVNALLTVLPILTVFLLLLNTLEDTGYILNLSVLTKRILEKLGLGGEGLITLVLGFGCKAMATLTARTIPSKREKYIVIFLLSFAIPCAPQLGLDISVLGLMGWSAFMIVFAVLVLSEICAGLLLNRFLKRTELNLAFIQDLPPIRLPKLKWVLKKTYFRLYSFLRESLLVFVLAAVGLFTLEKLGLLEATKKLLRPLIEGLLGLPLAMVDVMILCLARNEAGVGQVINLVRKGQLNYVQCIVAVILTTMAFPCFATFTAMARTLGVKSAILMASAIFITAVSMAGLLNWVLVVFV